MLISIRTDLTRNMKNMAGPFPLVFNIKLFSIFVCALAIFGCTQPQVNRTVVAKVETTPVPSKRDAADDPAIWVDHLNPEKTLVIGTDKRSGLVVYDLAGNQIQYLPDGNFNNVDLRQNPWGIEGKSILFATQRNPSELVVFILDHRTRKVEIKARHNTSLKSPYGTCLYQDKSGKPYAIVNSKDGAFVQYSISQDYSVEPTRSWKLNSQPEGCVANDETGELFLGEENVGIWRMSARPSESTEMEIVDTVKAGNVVADVEGLSLYRDAGRTLLLASSQGNNTFAVYDTANLKYLFSFAVRDGENIDGVSETDGIDVVSVPLPGFPKGLLVAQDGHNLPRGEHQNFKYISWSDIEESR